MRPRRRTLWLSALLLLVVVGGLWLVARPNRITQENFNLIHSGMSEEEVSAILGEGEMVLAISGTKTGRISVVTWDGGTTRIKVNFRDGEVSASLIETATMWATLKRYAKKGAAKIGVKWD